VNFVGPKESVGEEKKGEKLSEEKPSEQPHPKPAFSVTIAGEMVVDGC
jgi:hypothetical protein